MRLLVLGGDSQIGRAFGAMPPEPELEITLAGREMCDVTSADEVEALIGAAPWDAVINTVAYTDVERAETETRAAFALNEAAAAEVASAARRHGRLLIHISTDYVFDGGKGAPYGEEDATAPLNQYGLSKLAGEAAVRRLHPRHVILRTAWLFSSYKRNFVTTMLRAARDSQVLKIVEDQWGNPTGAGDLAQACLEIARRRAAGRPGPYGTYHCAGSGAASRLEFARAIFEAAARKDFPSPGLEPVPMADYNTLAVRPRDSRLDCSAIARDWGIEMRPWRTALGEAIERIFGQDRSGR